MADNDLPPGFSTAPPKSEINASNFRQSLDSGALDAPGVRPLGQDLPPGFSAKPPEQQPKTTMKPLAPGREDASIAAQSAKQMAEADAPKSWADMAKDPKNPMWQRIGSAVMEEGKRFGQSAWGGFTVFGDVASGKASMQDPATQQRVIDAANWFGLKGAPGEHISKIAELAKEPAKEAPAAGVPRARAAGEKAVSDALGASVTENKVPAGHVRVYHGTAAPDTNYEAWVASTPEYARRHIGPSGRVMYADILKKELPESIQEQLDINPGTKPGNFQLTKEQSAKLKPYDDTKPVQQMRTSAQSGGAAATPVHELAEQNIKAFMEADKSPDLKQRLVAATKDAQSFYQDSESAKGIIRKNVGNEARTGAQAVHAMDQFKVFTQSLDREGQIGLLKWLQDPESKISKGLELSPEAKSFTDTFHSWMHTYQKKLEALPQTEKMEFRKNFVTQLWRQPQGAMKYINDFGAKQGSNYFTKARAFDDYEAGIRAGFAPVTTDPMELFARYIENAQSKLASWESLNDAKEQGLVAYRSPQNAPEGWTPLKGVTTPRGEQAYAPPGFAQVYNNYTSRPPEGWVGKGLDWAQKASNNTTKLKLALSAFHATLETGESVISGMADGIDKIAGGHPLRGVFELGTAVRKPFTSFPSSRKAVKAYLTGEYGSPEQEKIIQGLVDANYDFLRQGKLADEYRNSRFPGFIKSWERGRLKAEFKDMNRNLPRSQMIVRTGTRAFDTIMEPLFQYYIPALKTQAATDMMKTYLEAHPNATREELGKYGMVVSDTVDNRLGEMNHDNIFWSSTAKKMAQTAMLSYSYTLGTARLAGGAYADLSAIPAKVLNRALGGPEEKIWTPRLSYAIAMGLGTGLMSATYQYLKTGKPPEDVKDLYRPQTGGTDPINGQPERATLPMFFNAFRNFWLNPGQEAYNKINPLWQVLYSVSPGVNEDWKKQPIYDGNEPVTKQLEQAGNYIASNIGEPVSFGNVGDAKPGSHVGSIERLFGIRAAGGRDTNPEGTAQAISYNTAAKWYDKRRSDINALRSRQGLGPLHIRQSEKSKLIQQYMRHPEVDPLQKYGGTQ